MANAKLYKRREIACWSLSSVFGPQSADSDTSGVAGTSDLIRGSELLDVMIQSATRKGFTGLRFKPGIGKKQYKNDSVHWRLLHKLPVFPPSPMVIH